MARRTCPEEVQRLKGRHEGGLAKIKEERWESHESTVELSFGAVLLARRRGSRFRRARRDCSTVIRYGGKVARFCCRTCRWMLRRADERAEESLKEARREFRRRDRVVEVGLTSVVGGTTGLQNQQNNEPARVCLATK